jgi:hypothetical protein
VLFTGALDGIVAAQKPQRRERRLILQRWT